jgi:hypothetical protein
MFEDNDIQDGRSPNERFHASGGVCPQTVLCEFASASPARTFVNPRLREAAGTLSESGGQHKRREKALKTDRQNTKNHLTQFC